MQKGLLNPQRQYISIGRILIYSRLAGPCSASDRGIVRCSDLPVTVFYNVIPRLSAHGTALSYYVALLFPFKNQCVGNKKPVVGHRYQLPTLSCFCIAQVLNIAGFDVSELKRPAYYVRFIFKCFHSVSSSRSFKLLLSSHN